MVGDEDQQDMLDELMKGEEFQQEEYDGSDRVDIFLKRPVGYEEEQELNILPEFHDGKTRTKLCRYCWSPTSHKLGCRRGE